jgi:hypothetical protein
MARTLALIAALVLVPGLAEGDQGRFLPREFPLGLGGFWWKESVVTVRSKCLTFASRGKRNFWCKSKSGPRYVLAFDRANRLDFVSAEISEVDYSRCQREISDAIGPVGRHETDGLETWSIAYNQNGVQVGLLSCSKRVQECSGAKHPLGCQPVVSVQVL